MVAIIISSCGSSNSVVSNSGISKRKYNKGFFFKPKSNFRTAKKDAKDVELKEEKSVAKVEKAELKKVKKAVKRSTVVESPAVETSRVAVVESNEVESTSFETETPFTSDALESVEGGLDWTVVENQPSATGESIEAMPIENRNKSNKKKTKVRQGYNADAIFVLAVIFAILLPPLGVGIYTNIDWMKVLIAFLLTLLGVLPGVIYAVLVVFDVI